MILLASLAAAACSPEFAAPPDTQSVVWVSRLRKTVGRNGRVHVVPLAALRKVQKRPLTSGRMLQVLGLRKKARNPRRPWKVTVFEASSGGLCRPVAGDETLFVDGLPVCRKRESRETRSTTGCGKTVDRAGVSKGVELYVASWRDLAPQGFCVFPLERFVADLAKRDR